MKTILYVLYILISLQFSYTQEISLSHHGGFYSKPINLIIRCSNCDSIYYTINGEEPDRLSNKYTSPIQISNKLVIENQTAYIPTTSIPNKNYGEKYFSWQEPEGYPKAAAISIKGYKLGQPVTETLYKTYFINTPDFSLPVLSLITNPSGLFHNDTGIYVPGIRCDTNNSIWTGNYHMRGKSWERKAYLQFFENKKLIFEQIVGLRIHGSKTRSAPQKSLRVYPRKPYGSDYINYSIFNNLNKPVKRFILQSPFGPHRATLITDIVIHELCRPLNLEIMDYNPCIVFINGEYWGLHFIRERIDNYFINNHYNFNPDSVLIRDNAHEQFNSVIDYIERINLSDSENYEKIQRLIDIPCFIDYAISETYFRNLDWFGSNEGYWKPENKGMWRFVLYDLDAGFQRYKKNMFPYIEENKNSPVSRLFRVLIKNKKFKNDFINRYAYVVNTYFSSKRAFEIINSVSKSIEPEIKRQSHRWRIPESKYRWYKSLDYMKKFANRRPKYVDIHLKAYFNIEQTKIRTNKRQLFLNTEHVIILVSGIFLLCLFLLVIYYLRRKKYNFK